MSLTQALLLSPAQALEAYWSDLVFQVTLDTAFRATHHREHTDAVTNELPCLRDRASCLQ